MKTFSMTCVPSLRLKVTHMLIKIRSQVGKTCAYLVGNPMICVCLEAQHVKERIRKHYSELIQCRFSKGKMADVHYMLSP